MTFFHFLQWKWNVSERELLPNRNQNKIQENSIIVNHLQLGKTSNFSLLNVGIFLHYSNSCHLSMLFNIQTLSEIHLFSILMKCFVLKIMPFVQNNINLTSKCKTIISKWCVYTFHLLSNNNKNNSNKVKCIKNLFFFFFSILSVCRVNLKAQSMPYQKTNKVGFSLIDTLF